MTCPDPARDSLYKYLKQDFPWQKDWDVSKITHLRKDLITYDEIKNALQEVKKINPEIHRFLSYLVNANRKREDIASHHKCDTSTLKRKTNQGFDMMLNIINNKDVFFQLEPIDLQNYI
jgi:hypothetical protein